MNTLVVTSASGAQTTIRDAIASINLDGATLTLPGGSTGSTGGPTGATGPAVGGTGSIGSTGPTGSTGPVAAYEPQQSYPSVQAALDDFSAHAYDQVVRGHGISGVEDGASIYPTQLSPFYPGAGPGIDYAMQGNRLVRVTGGSVGPTGATGSTEPVGLMAYSVDLPWNTNTRFAIPIMAPGGVVTLNAVPPADAPAGDAYLRVDERIVPGNNNISLWETVYVSGATTHALEKQTSPSLTIGIGVDDAMVRNDRAPFTITLTNVDSLAGALWVGWKTAGFA